MRNLPGLYLMTTPTGRLPGGPEIKGLLSAHPKAFSAFTITVCATFVVIVSGELHDSAGAVPVQFVTGTLTDCAQSTQIV